MSDDLGDRMKGYERRETERLFLPFIPIYARIDGRCFSSFTSGMKRPFDALLSETMISTTRYLVEETQAICGYTQSDEISLAWCTRSPKEQLFFGGKAQKMVSACAALATAKFITLASDIWPDLVRQSLPTFDCRVFQLPTMDECANAFLWREQDATKNAISMAARSLYSHKELFGKSGSEMQEMLFRKGVNFNDYPAFFKRGTFVQRRTRKRWLMPEETARIPAKHQPTGPIDRSEVTAIQMPPFSKVQNRVAVLFDGADPQVHTQPPGAA